MSRLKPRTNKEYDGLQEIEIQIDNQRSKNDHEANVYFYSGPWQELTD